MVAALDTRAEMFGRPAPADTSNVFWRLVSRLESATQRRLIYLYLVVVVVVDE